MSTSTKTTKTRGAASTATTVKRTRRAGNNRKAPVNKIQSDLTKDEAVSQKLDALMASMEAFADKMTVLSGRVDATEKREKDAETPPGSHHPANATRRRAWPQASYVGLPFLHSHVGGLLGCPGGHCL